MKLLFKPVKWLFRIILVLVVLILILVALMYKSVKVPVISNDTKSFSELINEELDDLTDNTITDKSIDLSVDVNTINKSIRDQLLKVAAKSSDDYVIDANGVKTQGAWVTYENQNIDFHIGMHIDTGILTFKTRLLIGTKVEYNDELLVLTINKIKIGNLGALWLTKLAPNILENRLNVNIEQKLKEVLNVNDLSFDKKNLKLKLNLMELLIKNETTGLNNMVLSILNDNDMLDVHLDELGLKLDLNKLEDKNNYPLFTISNITNFKELETFVTNKAISSIITSPKELALDESSLNSIMYHFLNFKEDYLSKTTLINDYYLRLDLPFFTMNNSKAVLNVPIKIGKDNKYFNSNIKINVNFKKVNQDLVVEFTNVTIANLIINEDTENELLGFLNKTLKIEDNKMVIKDLFNKISFNNLQVSEIYLKNKDLVLKYHLDNNFNLIDDLIDHIDLPSDLKDVANSIKDALANNEEPLDHIDDLIREIEQLTNEEKEVIKQILSEGLKKP